MDCLHKYYTVETQQRSNPLLRTPLLGSFISSRTLSVLIGAWSVPTLALQAPSCSRLFATPRAPCQVVLAILACRKMSLVAIASILVGLHRIYETFGSYSMASQQSRAPHVVKVMVGRDMVFAEVKVCVYDTCRSSSCKRGFNLHKPLSLQVELIRNQEAPRHEFGDLSSDGGTL